MFDIRSGGFVGYSGIFERVNELFEDMRWLVLLLLWRVFYARNKVKWRERLLFQDRPGGGGDELLAAPF